MKDTALPLRRFNTTDYANVDPNFIGRSIPIAYGTLVNLAPVEVNTSTKRWKILDQAIAELTAIRSATKSPLISGLDYTPDLALAEFTLLTPVYLGPTSTYYFQVEADYPQSGANYVGLKRNDNQYAYGTSYAIDSGDTWTPDASDYDLLFVAYGKASPSASEGIIATNTSSDATADIGLKDSEPNTKAGQSFMPSSGAYLTRVVVYITKHGTTTGYSLRLKLFSDTSGTQVGQDGSWILISSGVSNLNLTVPERNEDEALECDVKAPGTELNTVGDILEDLMETVMGKANGILDATELANLETDRTETLKLLIKSSTTFGDVLATLEAGQLWKLIPKQDGTYMPIVQETGEPAGTPHFRDEDFLSFRMEIDSSKIKQRVAVLYDQDEETDEYKTVGASSDIAKFFYMNEEELEVETYLVSGTAAGTYRDAYLARYEVPIIRAVFEVHGWALEKLPFRDKVKLTRARAAYAGGALSAVLFRIEKLVKRPENNSVEITAAIWGNSAT